MIRYSGKCGANHKYGILHAIMALICCAAIVFLILLLNGRDKRLDAFIPKNDYKKVFKISMDRLDTAYDADGKRIQKIVELAEEYLADYKVTHVDNCQQYGFKSKSDFLSASTMQPIPIYSFLEDTIMNYRKYSAKNIELLLFKTTDYLLPIMASGEIRQGLVITENDGQPQVTCFGALEAADVARIDSALVKSGVNVKYLLFDVDFGAVLIVKEKNRERVIATPRAERVYQLTRADVVGGLHYYGLGYFMEKYRDCIIGYIEQSKKDIRLGDIILN